MVDKGVVVVAYLVQTSFRGGQIVVLEPILLAVVVVIVVVVFVVAVVNGLVVSKGEFLVFQIHKVVDTEFAGVGRILVVLRYPAQVAFKDMLAMLVFFARIIDPTKLFHKPFKGTILQRRHVFCQRANHGTKKEGCQQQQGKTCSTTTTTTASDLHDDVSKRTSFGELSDASVADITVGWNRPLRMIHGRKKKKDHAAVVALWGQGRVVVEKNDGPFRSRNPHDPSGKPKTPPGQCQRNNRGQQGVHALVETNRHHHHL